MNTQCYCLSIIVDPIYDMVLMWLLVVLENKYKISISYPQLLFMSDITTT